MSEYETELKREGAHGKSEGPQIELDSAKVYDLPALIDIAERENPQTRIAWERAKQAASSLALGKEVTIRPV